MIETFQLFERMTLLAPLGVRFWDAVSARYLKRGLRVRVFPADNPARRTFALPNSSGTYVLHHAPGLGGIERGAGDDEFWNNLPARTLFRIEVADEERRFIPFSLDCELPCRGLFKWPHPPALTRLGPENGVPLYSSVVREVPPGMAVLRADLRDTRNGRAAAWALLEARHKGLLLGRGVADEQGRLALIFPFPEPLDFTSGVASPPDSPPGSPPVLFTAGPAFRQQEWRIQLQAAYSPEALASPPPAPPSNSKPTLPDLHDVLSQQPTKLWNGQARTQILGEVKLTYGQEIIVRSPDTVASPPSTPTLLPELFISTVALQPS
jgi:hypothetical protein